MKDGKDVNKVQHRFFFIGPQGLSHVHVHHVYVWYYGGYLRITMTRRDFTEVIECSF
jgi:hypothetical protein